MRSAPVVEYEVDKELGRGISGVVFLVHPVDAPDQSVALKRMDVSQSGPEVTAGSAFTIVLVFSRGEDWTWSWRWRWSWRWMALDLQRIEMRNSFPRVGYHA